MTRWLLAAGILLLTLLPPVAAQQIGLTVTPSAAEVRVNTYLTFQLSITNNLGHDEDFVISLIGDRPWWRDVGYILLAIPSGETRTVTEGFYPVDAEERVYNFSFKVRSFSSPDIQAASPFTITILPPVILKSLTVERKGGLMASLIVDSAERRTIDLQFDVIGPDGRIVRTFSSRETVSGVVTIRKPVPDPELAGTYTVRATTGKTSASGTFTIGEVRGLKAESQILSTFWYRETVIRAENSGNVPDTYIAERTFRPEAVVTGLITAPEVQQGFFEQKHMYSLPLQPGESGEIRYREEHWPTLLRLVVLCIVIGVLGMSAAGRYTRPRLFKHYRRTPRGASVVLIAKNGYGHARGVTVRDWVGPLGQVLEGEFETLRPIVRASEVGTELLWQLGDMRPREERLLNYKIRPLVQGTLKLAPATIRFKDRKGTPQRRASNPIILR